MESGMMVEMSAGIYIFLAEMSKAHLHVSQIFDFRNVLRVLRIDRHAIKKTCCLMDG